MGNNVKIISKSSVWRNDLQVITIILGTQDKSFKRLLEEVEKLIVKGIIKEPVIVQAGYTEYESDKMEIKKFFTHEELLELMKKSSFIISHAGVGTIMEGIRNEKKMIVVPRRKIYQEHTNDHQLQILNHFGREGYIIPVYEMKDLESAIKKVKTFVPKTFQAGNQKMISILQTFIESVGK